MSVPFIITDAQMLAKLDRLDGPVTFCTSDGRVVGTFSPPPPVRFNLQPQISEEELRRREAEGGGRKLKDILRDLEARG